MSNDTKHTPGPWMAGVMSDYIAARDGSIVANIPTDYSPVDGEHAGNMVADARLISAAPDLLAACNAAIDAAVWCKGFSEEAINTLRAAIAKAEGR